MKARRKQAGKQGGKGVSQDSAEVPERKAGGASNRVLDTLEALLWILLVAGASWIGWIAMQESDSKPDAFSRREAITIGGLIEAEDLRLNNRRGQFNFWLQPTSGFGEGSWSKDAHMFADRSQLGDWVEWVLPPIPAGSYRLQAFLTRARDYGVVQLSLNGVKIGEQIDLFVAWGVVPTGAIDFGMVELHEGGDLLRIQVIGTNPSSAPPHYQLGIDGIRIGKPSQSEP